MPNAGFPEMHAESLIRVLARFDEQWVDSALRVERGGTDPADAEKTYSGKRTHEQERR
jgi:hypothetical protein